MILKIYVELEITHKRLFNNDTWEMGERRKLKIK